MIRKIQLIIASILITLFVGIITIVLLNNDPSKLEGLDITVTNDQVNAYAEQMELYYRVQKISDPMPTKEQLAHRLVLKALTVQAAEDSGITVTEKEVMGSKWLIS